MDIDNTNKLWYDIDSSERGIRRNSAFTQGESTLQGIRRAIRAERLAQHQLAVTTAESVASTEPKEQLASLT